MEKLCNYLDFPHSILVHLSLYILCKWLALKYTLLVSEGSLCIQHMRVGDGHGRETHQ